jgi:hypothetical protein
MLVFKRWWIGFLLVCFLLVFLFLESSHILFSSFPSCNTFFDKQGKSLGCDYSLVSVDGLYKDFIVRVNSLEKDIKGRFWLVIVRQKTGFWIKEKYLLVKPGLKFSLDRQNGRTFTFSSDVKVEYRSITPDQFKGIFKKFVGKEVILIVGKDNIISNIRYVEMDSN